MTNTVINPASGDELNSYQEMSPNEVSTIIETMESVRQEWHEVPISKRGELMMAMAKELKDRSDRYAKIITQEMGKPITQARGEIEKCAWLCEYYAHHTEQHLKPQIIETEKSKSYRTFKPLGIIFAIMPWNFPFWQVLRFAVPNIMVGNAGLLKHAPNSTGAALVIEKLFVTAGFPEGLFRSLVIDVDQTDAIISHPSIQGVTITGSGRAGKSVASRAGEALKKVVLELGGSDPYLILDDADLDLAVEQCITSRLSNAGQVCIAAKRILVTDAIYDEFLEKVKVKVKTFQCGDPMEDETNLGPMAREDLRNQLHDQVERAIEAGATCLIGGEPEDGKGFYYPATLLVDVTTDNPAFREEFFGPVVTIIRASDENEAIRMANDSPYGLGAAVFTQDLAKGEDIAANQLEAGTCNVNCLVGSDPRLPFGGIKESGFGRELSVEGLHEFMNIKTVNIA